VKWLTKTIQSEERALERARRRFIAKPTQRRLHDVRTAGRRFRSLLEDVAGLAPSPRLLRRVKRAAAATDAARDAAIILQLLETSVDDGESETALPLLHELRERERLAMRLTRTRLKRTRFAPDLPR
jgi:CHAD domain-containing protein